VTRSVYVVGGAGTGKSTFTQTLLDLSNRSMGPLVDLYQKPNSRGTVITLRGHDIGLDGMYLGCMRESFPGTDGLDRVSYIPGEEWLQNIDGSYDFIIAEGATLAVRRFLAVLHETTDLLLIHLTADDFVKELRFGQRGSDQDEKFVLATATRSRNLVADMAKVGVKVREVDSANPEEWEQALLICHEHLRFP
jgi:hypothetical protein